MSNDPNNQQFLKLLLDAKTYAKNLKVLFFTTQKKASNLQ